DATDDECTPLAGGVHRATEPFENQIVEGEVLRAALAQLKPEDVACLLLRSIQGFTISEIAQIVGIAPDAARKRIARAVERLRVAYFEQEVEHQQMPESSGERADR